MRFRVILPAGSLVREATVLHNEAQLTKIIGRIYEAALDPEQWGSVLGEVCRALDGVAFQMYAIDIESRDVVYHLDHNLPQQYVEEYRDYYTRLSERNDVLLRNRDLAVIYDYMHFSDTEIDRSEMYHWRAGFGIRYFIGGSLLRTESTLAMAALHRSRRQGHADERDIEVYRAIRPHLGQALTIQDKLAGLEYERRGAWQVIERMAFGVVVISRDRHVLHCNREARRIIAERDGFSHEDGGLAALRPIDAAALQRLISGAIATALGQGHEGGGFMPVAKGSSPRPYAVMVAPIVQQASLFALDRAAVVVFLSDPDRTPETPVQLLRRVHGLTRREASLALAMGAGASLAGAADKLRIAKTTARSHLASIFAKTGIHRQADLVRLILSLPPERLH